METYFRCLKVALGQDDLDGLILNLTVLVT